MPVDSLVVLADPAVTAVPIIDDGCALVRLDRLGLLVSATGPHEPGTTHTEVRACVAERLLAAQRHLPAGLQLLIVEGHRSPVVQQRIWDSYARQVAAAHPSADADERHRLTSRFVAPAAQAPHVAGSAVDLTLADNCGRPLDLGTPIDATPEQSAGACYFAAENIPAAARELRDALAHALSTAGLINYPTEWWHWSFGDRYWAFRTGAPEGLHDPSARLHGPAARRRDGIPAGSLPD